MCAQPGRAPALLGCGHSCLRVAKEEFGYLQQPSTAQCAAKEKREPSPHISVPAQPMNCAGPLQLPALKHFSAAEARRVSHSSRHSWWRHKSRALLCCFLQGSLLPCSSGRLCHPWMRVGWGILEADTARAGSWLRHEQVTGQDVVTKKPFCSGVPPKCTLGIV